MQDPKGQAIESVGMILHEIRTLEMELAEKREWI
jgi:hypothetical protein